MGAGEELTLSESGASSTASPPPLVSEAEDGTETSACASLPPDGAHFGSSRASQLGTQRLYSTTQATGMHLSCGIVRDDDSGGANNGDNLTVQHCGPDLPEDDTKVLRRVRRQSHVVLTDGECRPEQSDQGSEDEGDNGERSELNSTQLVEFVFSRYQTEGCTAGKPRPESFKVSQNKPPLPNEFSNAGHGCPAVGPQDGGVEEPLCCQCAPGVPSTHQSFDVCSLLSCARPQQVSQGLYLTDSDSEASEGCGPHGSPNYPPLGCGPAFSQRRATRLGRASAADPAAAACKEPPITILHDGLVKREALREKAGGQGLPPERCQKPERGLIALWHAFRGSDVVPLGQHSTKSSRYPTPVASETKDRAVQDPAQGSRPPDATPQTVSHSGKRGGRVRPGRPALKGKVEGRKYWAREAGPFAWILRLGGIFRGGS